MWEPLQILDLPNTTVIAGARSPEKAEDLQKLSQQFSGRLVTVPLDLSDSNTVQVTYEQAETYGATPQRSQRQPRPSSVIQAAVETVKKSHKDGIDFLINNAGVLGTFAQIKDQ